MSATLHEHAHRTIEAVARESYGRLVAFLSSHTNDLASAEDALGDAFLKALTTWPHAGVPQKPEAWLFTAARNRLIDDGRHQQVTLASEQTVRLLREHANQIHIDDFPDERLKLLFVCAHPAIDPALHTPLMLQTILGLDAARIAQAFLVSAPTMSQRLVRAKANIKDLSIPFVVPQSYELPSRLDAVLEAIYAAFGIGWDDIAGADQRRRDLTEEAIWLARVVRQLLPRENEVRGLLALMLHCEARRTARLDRNGRYVPLSHQDPQQWSLPLIEEAEQLLSEASQHRQPGRFQLEAAIQSVHADRARTGHTEWPAIVLFYEQLLRLCPTVGTHTGYAAALAEVKGPEAALEVLDAVASEAIQTYQPYWAVRAHLLQQLGKTTEAGHAFDLAIRLAEEPAVSQFLLKKRG